MNDEFQLPIFEMEELEYKYNIHLHLVMYDKNDYAFYLVNECGSEHVGNTIDEVRREMFERYGY